MPPADISISPRGLQSDQNQNNSDQSSGTDQRQSSRKVWSPVCRREASIDLQHAI